MCLIFSCAYWEETQNRKSRHTFDCCQALWQTFICHLHSISGWSYLGNRFNTFGNYFFLCQSLLESHKEPHFANHCRDWNALKSLGFCFRPFWFAQHILANKVDATPVSSGRRCSAFSVTECGEKPWQDIPFIFTAFAGHWVVLCHYQGVGTSHPSWNEEVWQENPPERRFQEELESVTSGPCPLTLVKPTAGPRTLFFPFRPLKPLKPFPPLCIGPQ